MAEPVKRRTSRTRFAAPGSWNALLPLESVALLLGVAAATTGLSIEAFWAQLISPVVIASILRGQDVKTTMSMTD
jgi:hypothetical protein